MYLLGKFKTKKGKGNRLSPIFTFAVYTPIIPFCGGFVNGLKLCFKAVRKIFDKKRNAFPPFNKRKKYAKKDKN